MGRDRGFWAAVGFGIVGLVVHAVLALSIGEDYAIPTTILGVAGAAIVLRGPVGQALARRIQSGPAEGLPPEQLLGELDELRGRVAELEERVDFSERLLARQRESDEPPR